MKAIIHTLRKANCIANESLLISRDVLYFSNTNDGLWNGAKRYVH